MIRGLSRLAMNQQFRTIEVTGQEHIAEIAGILTVGWHTNGLIDPSTIFVTQPKMLVFGGRHDLITRPIIGPIASLSGAQPVLRQAELARGGASSEAGLRINGKTMLTLAECIAHGHGTALFPEGTSHEDSKMRRPNRSCTVCDRCQFHCTRRVYPSPTCYLWGYTTERLGISGRMHGSNMAHQFHLTVLFIHPKIGPG